LCISFLFFFSEREKGASNTSKEDIPLSLCLKIACNDSHKTSPLSL
jgi:hypothetical protein